MKRSLLPIGLLLLAGCAQLPPSPQDMQAKKFEAVPDKAVVYIVRSPMDSQHPAQVFLDDFSVQVPTLRGTYYRWETPSGTKQIIGVTPSSAAVTLNVEAGKIYFVEYTVYPGRRGSVGFTALQQVGDRYGRTIVGQSQIYP